ncbi:MAG TPA: pilus assembly protein TadG-related protein, partial [Candidatus Goldiibacteriota bacterium]|nr:pilus assembly protein TadG-related protein [Candidatus Goldiibacteriota bacterium]
MRLAGGKKGQVIAMAAVVMLAIFILALAALEFGNMYYAKIHLQNSADAAAMEAATWYARCL